MKRLPFVVGLAGRVRFYVSLDLKWSQDHCLSRRHIDPSSGRVVGHPWRQGTQGPRRDAEPGISGGAPRLLARTQTQANGLPVSQQPLAYGKPSCKHQGQAPVQRPHCSFRGASHGAWLSGNSTPIRLNKFSIGESSTSCSAGRGSSLWPVRRAASAGLRPWCA
jgi:hypothetical protein